MLHGGTTRISLVKSVSVATDSGLTLRSRGTLPMGSPRNLGCQFWTYWNKTSCVLQLRYHFSDTPSSRKSRSSDCRGGLLSLAQATNLWPANADESRFRGAHRADAGPRIPRYKWCDSFFFYVPYRFFFSHVGRPLGVPLPFGGEECHTTSFIA